MPTQRDEDGSAGHDGTVGGMTDQQPDTRAAFDQGVHVLGVGGA